MITAFIDLTELFWRLFQGDWIAWAFLTCVVLLIVVVVADVIVVWKTPQPAKRMTMNNIFAKNPMLADCYEDQYTRFETPSIFRHAMMYDGKNFHFIPGPTTEQCETLSLAEQEAIKKVYSVGGTGTPFYFACSSKATVLNPAIVAMIEHQKLLRNAQNKKKTIFFPGKDAPKNKPISVPKQSFIELLQSMPEKEILLEPMWATLLLDPRNIQTYLAQSTTQVQLMAHEEKIKRDAMNYGGGGKLIVVEILVVITIVIGILNLLRGFGVF